MFVIENKLLSFNYLQTFKFLEMNKFKLIQISLLFVIAFSAIGILIQNQMILNRLSLKTSENPNYSVKKASFTSGQNFAILPVNADGSIDVNLKSTDVIDVNIEEVSGYSVYRKVPVEVK